MDGDGSIMDPSSSAHCVCGSVFGSERQTKGENDPPPLLSTVHDALLLVPGTRPSRSFAAHPDSNPLGWGSLYNFWFDANVAPGDGGAALGVYRTDMEGPASFSGVTRVPGEGVLPPPEERRICVLKVRLIFLRVLASGLAYNRSDIFH